MTSTKITNTFHSVCKDCGTVSDESLDGSLCPCGGIFHVDSARCMGCGKRHPFNLVNSSCECGGKIMSKIVTCPACGQNHSVEHLDEYCNKCNVQLRMEG